VITDKDTYIALAVAAVKEHASSHKEFLMEDVSLAASAAGLDDPQEPRWWGGVAHAARKAGHIEKSGVYGITASGSRPQVLWRSKLI
jgi:hypothetical protein